MRQVGLSVLKTICCFCAVTFYSTSQLCNDFCFVNNQLFSILYFLSIIATPLFFIINGYSDQKTYDVTKLKNIDWYKIFSVAIIFVFWNTISYLVFTKNGFNSYFLQSWLLISLASIYLLNPLFTGILSRFRLAYLALITFAIFLVVKDILTLLELTVFLDEIPDYFRIWTWFFYYYLGRFLALRKISILIQRKKIKRYAKMTIIPLIIGFYIYESMISKYLLKKFNATYFLDSSFLIALTFSIFIIFDNISIRSQYLKNIFHFIAPAMIGVYILHDAVFFYLNYFYPIENSMVAIIYLLIIFTLSVLLSRLLLLNKLTARLVQF